MKFGPTIALVALVLLMAGVLWRENSALVSIEMSRDSLLRASTEYALREALWQAQDLARQDSLAAEERLVTRAVARERSSRRIADSLRAALDTFGATVPRPVVDTLLAARDSVEDALDQEIRSLRRVADIQAGMIVQRDSSIKILHAMFHATQDLAERWRRAAKPPVFSLQRPRLRPIVGCGVTVGPQGACIIGLGLSF